MFRGLISLTILLLTVLSGTAFAQNAPSVLQDSLLDHVQLLHRTGQFRMEEISVAFLPAPGDEDNDYNMYTGNGSGLWTILRTASGEELYRFDWTAYEMQSPIWLLSQYKATDLRSGEDAGTGWVDMAMVGDFVLDFHLSGGVFRSFPFSIKQIAPDDPFAGDPYWFLNGEWDDWACFRYAEGNPDNSISFHVWLRLDEYRDEQDHDLVLKVTNSSGKVVAQSDGARTYMLNPTLRDFAINLTKADGGYMVARELLAVDGSYTVTLSISGSEYGKWKFSIAGGKFAQAGRTVRGSEPQHFVEGGREDFWYSR